MKLAFHIYIIGFVFTAFFAIASFLQNSTGLPFGYTTIWWGINTTFLVASFFLMKLAVDKKQLQILWPIAIYLLFNVLNIVRGTFIAETYWDWKGLYNNGLGLLVPIVAYGVTLKSVFPALLRKYVLWGIPIFALVCMFISKGTWGYYLIPISVLLLFFPLLSFRAKIFVSFIAVIVLTADLGARSSVIKFALPLLFASLYFFKSFLTTQYFLITRNLMFIVPIAFLYLGVNGTFNLFNMESYTGLEASESVDWRHQQEALTTDTRTFLYQEVISSAEYFNSWIFGRSPARGNRSVVFGYLDENGRGERLANEVAILNVFTWTGLIGVFLYALIFFKATSLAIASSNSFSCKILGLYICFRWVYSWVEDFNNFNIGYVVLWMLIGLCYSKNFRAMTDAQIASWVNSIFKFRVKI